MRDKQKGPARLVRAGPLAFYVLPIPIFVSTLVVVSRSVSILVVFFPLAASLFLGFLFFVSLFVFNHREIIQQAVIPKASLAHGF